MATPTRRNPRLALQFLKQHYHDALSNQLDAAADALAQQWAPTRALVLTRIEQLQTALAAAQDAGQPVNLTWLTQEGRLQTLLTTIDNAASDFGQAARDTIGDAQADAVDLGSQAAQDMLQATVPDGMAYTFGVPPQDALDAMSSALDDSSPLSGLLDGFGADAAASAQQALFNGVALGQSAAQIASMLTDATDMTYSRAETIARTELLGAYRDAQMANYRANSDVVNGWMWSADFSERTCGACLALDGTIHTLDEDLDDHINGRCSALPVTNSWGSILGQLGMTAEDLPIEGLVDTSAAYWTGPTGRDWFAAQSDELQARILGPAKFSAMQHGDITLSDLVGVRRSAVWGDSIYERSLREMGFNARDYITTYPLPADIARATAAVERDALAPLAGLSEWEQQRATVIAQTLAQQAGKEVAGPTEWEIARRQAIAEATGQTEAAAMMAATAEGVASDATGPLDLSQRDLEQIIISRQVFTDPNTGRTAFFTSELDGKGYFIRPLNNTTGFSETEFTANLADRVGLGDFYLGSQTIEVDGQWYDVQPLLAGQQANEDENAILSSDRYMTTDERMQVALFSSLLGDADRFANNMWLTPDDKLVQIDYDIFGPRVGSPAQQGNDLLRPIDFKEDYERMIAAIGEMRPSPDVMDWLRSTLLSPDVTTTIMDGVRADAATYRDVDAIVYQEARLKAFQEYAALPGEPPLSKMTEIFQRDDLGPWMQAERDRLVAGEAPVFASAETTGQAATSATSDAQQALDAAQARVDALRMQWEETKAEDPYALPSREVRTAIADLAKAQAAVDVENGGRGAVILARGLENPFAAQAELDRAAAQMFGRALTRDELGGLVGAPEGAYVSIRAGGDYLNIELYGPSWDPLEQRIEGIEYRAARELTPDGHGEFYMVNTSLYIDPALQDQGLGAQIFSDQVETLSSLDVRYIETFGAGMGPGELGVKAVGENGYYTWPRFGYTGRIATPALARLQVAAASGDVPAEWGAFRTVQELMQTPEGRDWWKAFGMEGDLKFDLREGSLSRRILANYLDEVAAREASATETAATTEAAAAETTVTFTSDAARTRLTAAFDQPLTDDQVAALAGAPPGSTVEADKYGQITVTTPDYTSSVYVHTAEADGGGPTLLNWRFEGPDGTNSIPVDAESLGRQVRQANELGVEGIHMKARSGSMDFEQLPLLGYDAPIAQVLVESESKTLPAGLEGVQSLQELLTYPAGRDWWHDNGMNPGLDFDPHPGSLSWQILDAYLQSHGLEGLDA